MQPNRIFASAVILLIAVANNYMKYVYAYVVLGSDRYNAIDQHYRNLLIQITTLALCGLATLAFSSFSVRRALHLLGLNKNLPRALAIAAVCALPMFIGGYLHGGMRSEPGMGKEIIKYALIPGIAEEIVYRAFVVGLLVRVAGWHFFPAAFISGFIFAYGHLYQATDFASAITILTVTVAAGVGFALFYRMWNWNIWFTVFLHIFMNMAFVIFDMGGTVLMTPVANIYRVATIVLAIIASGLFYYRRRKKQRQEDKPLPMVVGNNN